MQLNTAYYEMYEWCLSELVPSPPRAKVRNLNDQIICQIIYPDHMPSIYIGKTLVTGDTVNAKQTWLSLLARVLKLFGQRLVPGRDSRKVKITIFSFLMSDPHNNRRLRAT